MQETRALVVLAGMSPLFVTLAVYLLPIGVFLLVFWLIRRSTRAHRMHLTPRGRRFLYLGMAVLYLLISLDTWFNGRSLFSVVLIAVLSLLCLVNAVRQRV